MAELLFKGEGNSETTFDTLLLHIANIIDLSPEKTKFCSSDAMLVALSMSCLHLPEVVRSPYCGSMF